jgi:hypothetical protein
MRFEVWMGNKCVYINEVKNIERSIDGTFMKITSVSGEIIETSPNNIILYHKEGEQR